MIQQARVDLDSPLRETILQANSPQQFIPATKPRYGVLLIHGLLDSPYVMHDLFQLFQTENALVRSLLLPGHGTVPGDLSCVQLEAWRQCVEQGLQWMQQDVEQLVIVGFSTGASLALEYAVKNDLQCPMILISPALRIRNPLAPFSGCINALGSWIPSAKWVQQSQENDYAKYRSLPVNGVYQVHRLASALTTLLSQKTCRAPTFMLGSLDDEVISIPAIQDAISKNTHPDSFLWLYGEPKNPVEHPRICYRRSSFPEKRIIDFSHVSINNAPNNQHYGENGDFQDIGHYQTWWGKALTKVTTPKEAYLGALTPQNLRRHVMQRLTYNPDFANMAAEILRFVHTQLTIPAEHQTSV